jgi:hypothetical protein
MVSDERAGASELSPSRAADLDIPILGQLAPVEFALGDALEPGAPP